MKLKNTAWKVVYRCPKTKRLLSTFAAWIRGAVEVEYIPKRFVTEIKKSKGLFVFKNRESARVYQRGSKNGNIMSGYIEIWKCEVQNPRTPLFMVTPNGTVLCDAVKLIEKSK